MPTARRAANLSRQYVPATEILRILGDRCTAFSQSADPLHPALTRRYRDIRNGKQKWVSMATADKLLTIAGHHIWELEVEPRYGSCNRPPA